MGDTNWVKNFTPKADGDAEWAEGMRYLFDDANEKIGSHDVAGLYRIASAFESTVTLLTCEDERPEGGYASRRVVSARRVN